MLKKNLRNEKGFTLIELIIVIAIIAIISAILAPSFSRMTMRSRLKADINTARELTRQAGLYNADQGDYPSDIQDLVDDEYIDEEPKPQTKGATFEWQGDKYVVNLDGADEKVTKISETLSEDEKAFTNSASSASSEG